MQRENIFWIPSRQATRSFRNNTPKITGRQLLSCPFYMSSIKTTRFSSSLSLEASDRLQVLLKGFEVRVGGVWWKGGGWKTERERVSERWKMMVWSPLYTVNKTTPYFRQSSTTAKSSREASPFSCSFLKYIISKWVILHFSLPRPKQIHIKNWKTGWWCWG